jgi:hypothetical protein
MPITAICPECGKVGQVPDEFAKKRIRCPKCGTSFEVAPPEANRALRLAPSRVPILLPIKIENDTDRPQGNNTDETKRPADSSRKTWRTVGFIGGGLLLAVLLPVAVLWLRQPPVSKDSRPSEVQRLASLGRYGEAERLSRGLSDPLTKAYRARIIMKDNHLICTFRNF